MLSQDNEVYIAIHVRVLTQPHPTENSFVLDSQISTQFIIYIPPALLWHVIASLLPVYILPSLHLWFQLSEMFTGT